MRCRSHEGMTVSRPQMKESASRIARDILWSGCCGLESHNKACSDPSTRFPGLVWRLTLKVRQPTAGISAPKCPRGPSLVHLSQWLHSRTGLFKAISIHGGAGVSLAGESSYTPCTTFINPTYAGLPFPHLHHHQRPPSLCFRDRYLSSR